MITVLLVFALPAQYPEMPAQAPECHPSVSSDEASGPKQAPRSRAPRAVMDGGPVTYVGGYTPLPAMPQAGPPTTESGSCAGTTYAAPPAYGAGVTYAPAYGATSYGPVASGYAAPVRRGLFQGRAGGGLFRGRAARGGSCGAGGCG